MSKKVVGYKVVSEHILEKLVASVQDLIGNHGWQPLGGIQIAAPVLHDDEVAPLFVQSLVIYEN